jgi:hypothetical protein
MPPPVPPPVPRPISPPPVPPGVAPKSNRGLYMALGSLATLAVLIAAAIEGPKYLHGGSIAASEAAAPAANTPVPAAANPSPAPADPAVPATPATPAKTQSAWTPVGQSPAAASSQAVPPPVNAAPAPQPATPPQPAAPQPLVESQTPPAPAPVNRQYAQVREQLNELTIRANSASAGLQSFQQQQSRQGLGLRADIREAKTRLDYQLQEAMSSVQNGDLEAARQSMRYAQSAVETIEKFLGR